jgi:hypothetical protein
MSLHKEQSIGAEVYISGSDRDFGSIYLDKSRYDGKVGKIDSYDERPMKGKASYHVTTPNNASAWFPEEMLSVTRLTANPINSKNNLELDSFKEVVRATALKYAAANDLCDVVNEFLTDLGLNPIRKIDIVVSDLDDSTRRYLLEYLTENSIPFKVAN